MGKQTTADKDLAVTIVAGTFTGTGQSGNATRGLQSGLPTNNPTGTVPPVFKDIFNVALWGTFVATIQLEKSFDGGATWSVVSRDSTGTAAAYTAPMTAGVYEPEHNVIYRWNCTAFTSGTVNYRISQ